MNDYPLPKGQQPDPDAAWRGQVADILSQIENGTGYFSNDFERYAPSGASERCGGLRVSLDPARHAMCSAAEVKFFDMAELERLFGVEIIHFQFDRHSESFLCWRNYDEWMKQPHAAFLEHLKTGQAHD